MTSNWTRWLLGALLALSFAACKQGIGERCEVGSDCESGVCSEGEHICVEGANIIDARLTPDAADAAISDAADAATIDATGADAADAAGPDGG